MQFLDMKDYTRSAAVYWWVITAVGALGLAYGIYGVALLPASLLMQVLAGATVAAVVGFFPVRIPGSKTSLAGGEIFIFLILLLYGAAPAVVAAALEGFIASWRTSKRWTSRIGTPAMITLAMLGCANFLDLIRARLALDGTGSALLLSALMVFALLYYASIT